jgi:hypothetical protein
METESAAPVVLAFMVTSTPAPACAAAGDFVTWRTSAPVATELVIEIWVCVIAPAIAASTMA